MAEEAEEQADYLPYQVEPVKPEPHIIETDVQLSRDIMRVDSRTCIEYVPVMVEKIKKKACSNLFLLNCLTLRF